jgi:hypothetical protein
MTKKHALAGILIVGLLFTNLVDFNFSSLPRALANFNGDLYGDLAIGIPGEDIGDPVVAGAGAVNILNGSFETGLSSSGMTHLDQGVLPNSPGQNEKFGYALAAGDFNCDAFMDLAVGVPQEFITSRSNGIVHIIYGSRLGLTALGSELWSQDSAGILNDPGEFDYFGKALAAGDFDGDGCADLAVGVPWETIDVEDNAGAVNVIYGSSDGLTSDGNQFWSQGSSGIQGAPEAGDEFGSVLTTGDFDGDGYTDLAVGTPKEDSGDPVVWWVGAVNVIYGSSSGLTATGDELWQLSDLFITSEQNDMFGDSLATGDFNSDGYDELAIGVPGKDLAVTGMGAVYVLTGSGSGLTSNITEEWSQDTPGVQDVGEAHDGFGAELTTCDFNGDGYADLTVGVQQEDIEKAQPVSDVVDAGAVNVLYGSNNGLATPGNQIWDQDVPLIEGIAEDFDQFGTSLACGDFDGDGYFDLVVGSPFEDLNNPTVTDAGAINILYGSSGGLTQTGNQLWHRDSLYGAGSAQEFDNFGWAIAALPKQRSVTLPLVIASYSSFCQ